MPVFVAFAAAPVRAAYRLIVCTLVRRAFRTKAKNDWTEIRRTVTLEMVLDHDSGRMEGKCLKGRFAGRSLSSLSCNDLFDLLQELRATDAQGVRLLEAYLDRQFRGWRERHTNQDEEPKSSARHGRRHGMTVNQAYDVLGLNAGATKTDIRAAHRKLMMKFHPDQGGSTYFAARINEAKEILLAR